MQPRHLNIEGSNKVSNLNQKHNTKSQHQRKSTSNAKNKFKQMEYR